MNNKINDILTVNDLMNRYKMSHDKAYELVHNRNFPSFKIKGRFYIRMDLLLKWEENQVFIKQKSA